MYATPGVSSQPPADKRDIPLLTLKPQQITGLLDHLRSFWERFARFFQRREQREWGFKYLQGRLLDGGKHYTQPLARRLGEKNVRAMQNFVGASPWDDQAVQEEHQQTVQETLGEPEGLVIMDGTGFPRKGSESAGVARQYCNETGKVDNCQVGLFLTYASTRGYALLDRRLYLPQEWFSPEYAARRERCGIPEDLPFRTHQGLAWEMLEGVYRRGVVTFRWVLGDEEFGCDTGLLDQIAGLGKWYFMEVPADTQVWLERPQTEVPAWQGEAANLAANAWQRKLRFPRRWLRSQRGCRLRPGNATPCTREAKGLWWPMSPVCGWWRCETGCLALTSGWSSARMCSPGR